MWDKILVAIGGSAIGALSALVQAHHNRKTGSEQIAATEKIAADKLAARKAESANANAIEERRVAVEEQDSLRDTARFYREEIAERERMIDEREDELATARAEVRTLRDQLEAMRQTLVVADAHIGTLDTVERARIARLLQSLLDPPPPLPAPTATDAAVDGA